MTLASFAAPPLRAPRFIGALAHAMALGSGKASRGRSAAGPANAALSERERSRFRKEVLPHLDAAYNFACYLAHDRTIAEDVVQTAFARALAAYKGFRGGDSKAWILAIVRNCFYSQMRAQARGPAPFDPTGEDESIAFSRAMAMRANETSPEDKLLEEEAARRVRAAIASLPETFREVLVLREMEDLTYAEIARAIGAPIGTVMSRLARARALLADAWAAAERET